MQLYSQKQRLGIIEEKWIYAILSSLFPKSKNYRIFHVDWNNYTSSMGKGLDLKLFLRNKLLAVFEVKNWRLLDRPYGTDIIKTQVIPRFYNCGTNLKTLVITFKELLTRKALTLLRAHKIHIIETGKLIGKNDFPRKGKSAKIFYQIRNKLHELIKSHRTRRRNFGCVSHNFNQSKLVSNVDNTNDHIGHNKQTNKQHDSDCKIEPRNWLIEWCFTKAKEHFEDKKPREKPPFSKTINALL